MDETNLNAKPKRTRVLRAADVMPPFDKNIEPADESSTPVERQERGTTEPDDRPAVTGGLAIAADAVHDTPEDAQSPAAVAEIPSYDLAANILAEQRRVASRRRRAPAQTDDAPAAAPTASATRISVVEFPAQNLVELQETVAEIVARDIERLCRRSNRPLSE